MLWGSGMARVPDKVAPLLTRVLLHPELSPQHSLVLFPPLDKLLSLPELHWASYLMSRVALCMLDVLHQISANEVAPATLNAPCAIVHPERLPKVLAILLHRVHDCRLHASGQQDNASTFKWLVQGPHM